MSGVLGGRGVRKIVSRFGRKMMIFFLMLLRSIMLKKKKKS